MPGFLADALSRPENSNYALAVETALTWKVKPMDILLPVHQRAQMTDLDEDALASADIGIMKAWTILQRETCKKCGTPYWLGRNPDRYIKFDADIVTCYGCVAVEDYDKNQKERESGTTTYPVFSMYLEKPRPSRSMWLRGERTPD